MASLTNWAERQALGVLTGVAWSPALTLGLGTNTGTDAVPIIAEVSGGGYARISLSPALWTAATTSSFTFDPCSTGGFIYYSGRARLNSNLEFPVATAPYDFDSIVIYDGANVVSLKAGSGPVPVGYRVKMFAPLDLQMGYSSFVACPTVLQRGVPAEYGMKKVLDNMTGKTPWTPVPHLRMQDVDFTPEEDFVSTAGLWDAPTTNAAGNAESYLSTAVSFASTTDIARPFGFNPTLTLCDGADFTKPLVTFGLNVGSSTPWAIGDNLRVPANALAMRVLS